MAKSHSFDPAHAQAYGLEEAIIIHHFQWWLERNRADGKHLFEGRTWSFNSYSGIAVYFPYMNTRKVRNAIDHLVTAGVLLKRPVTQGGSNYYAFSDEGAFLANTPDKNGRGDHAKNVIVTPDKNVIVTPDKNGRGEPCQKWQGGAENVSPPDEIGSPNKVLVSTQLHDSDKTTTTEHPYLRAERFFGQTMLPFLSQFNGISVSPKCRDDYVQALSDWFAAGLDVTEEAIQEAVADAKAWWKREGKTGNCPTAEPVRRRLEDILNPKVQKHKKSEPERSALIDDISADAKAAELDAEMAVLSERINRAKGKK